MAITPTCTLSSESVGLQSMDGWSEEEKDNANVIYMRILHVIFSGNVSNSPCALTFHKMPPLDAPISLYMKYSRLR